MQKVVFNTQKNDFYLALRKRVNDYFKNENIDRHGDFRIKLKALVMILLYLSPYILFYFNVLENVWLFFGLWFLMGIGMAGIGTGVMHDANHGTFSKREWVNQLFGRSINFLGGNRIVWKIQHNVLHHTFTNVEGMDGDLEVGGLMRFSPTQKRYYFHRFQHIYAWFLYGLMTVSWMTTNDYKKMYKYHKQGLLKTQKTSFYPEIIKLSAYRIFYFTYTLILPLIFFDFAWWQILIGFFIMHYTASFLLSCIFQTAHVMETSMYEVPENNVISNNWAVHQLLNTANYAQKSHLFSWYAGGLNFQIEHHLFPSISHVHYKKLSRIIQETAAEFGLPYHSNTTFWQAIKVHYHTLKTLGRQASFA